MLIVVLSVRGCGGDEPKGLPVVIEVSVQVGDELPIAITVDHGLMLADEVIVEPGEGGNLLVGPELAAAIRKGVGDLSVEMPEGVDKLEDIGAVIIERISYTGMGRDGVVRKIRLVASLPDPPGRKTPEKVEIGIDDSNASLYDVIPWPAELSWSLIEGDKLKVVSGETVLELGVGKSGDLPPLAAEIPVIIEEVDDEANIPDGDDVKLPTVKRDLGKVKFNSAISVRYLGRLKLAEDKQ